MRAAATAATLPLQGLSLVVALPDDSEARAIARYLGDAGAATSIAVNATFTGIQIGLDRYIPLHDGPPGEGIVGLARPWRRDVLVRAAARAAGRTGDIATSEPVPHAPEKVGGRVLVVDDNQTNRTILQEMLASWRMVPIVSASAEAALKELRRSRETSQPIRLVPRVRSLSGVPLHPEGRGSR